MLRLLALTSVLALAAGTAFAQIPDATPSAPPAMGAPGYQPSPAYGPGMAGHIPADPQTRALRQAQRSACAADMANACASVDASDHHAMHQCMEENRTRFSPQCQQAISDLQAHRRSLRTNPGAPMTPEPGAAAPQDPQAPQ